MQKSNTVMYNDFLLQEVGRSTVVIKMYIHLSNILAFITGADSIPPLGFPTDLVILFNKDEGRLLPTSSTCSLSLTLSIELVEYDLFKRNMDLAVLNAFEFGQV